MSVEILQNISLHGALTLSENNAEFPQNPAIGTLLLKNNALYAYIQIGGMETWYPFASRTNSYVHTQSVAATTWYVNHNLHTTDVWTQIKDQNGFIVNANVSVIDEDNVEITFTSAKSGTVVVVAPDSIDVPEIKATLITVGANVVIDSSGVKINGSYALTAANIEAQISAAVAPKADKTYVDATFSKIGHGHIITDITNLETTLGNKQPLNANLTDISSLAGSGLLSKNAGGTWSFDANSYLTAHPTVSGATSVNNTGLTYVQDLVFDSNGHVTGQTSTTIQSASTSVVGVVQLTDSVSSTSITTAATPNAVKQAYDLANSAIQTSTLLDSNGLVLSSKLPSYVDDVIEVASQAQLPATGDSGKIYVVLDTNKTYRWSGSVYVEISASPGSTDAVTEGSTNLYFTTARASAAAPVQSVAGKTGTVTLVKADVGLSNVDNTADTNKVVASAGKLTTARTIQLTGNVTGSVSFDGSANASITTTVVAGSTSQSGIVQLTDSVSSSSTTTAATPNSVKSAYDLANEKQAVLVSGTNIKTINGTSVLGSGDISVSGLSSTDDLSTNSIHYPLFVTTAGGNIAKTSSSKLQFNPSTGTTFSTVFQSLSDIRLKTNIETIDNALDVVEQLYGVKYDWVDGSGTQYGFIAQSVEKVLPELVVSNDQYKTVNYSGIIPFLVEAVKQQQGMIDVLLERVNQLELRD